MAVKTHVQLDLEDIAAAICQYVGVKGVVTFKGTTERKSGELKTLHALVSGEKTEGGEGVERTFEFSTT